MSGEAAFNWAYLMYNWGFPPEIEEEDWEDFRKTVPIFKIKALMFLDMSKHQIASIKAAIEKKTGTPKTPRADSSITIPVVI